MIEIDFAFVDPQRAFAQNNVKKPAGTLLYLCVNIILESIFAHCGQDTYNINAVFTILNSVASAV